MKFKAILLMVGAFFVLTQTARSQLIPLDTAIVDTVVTDTVLPPPTKKEQEVPCPCPDPAVPNDNCKFEIFVTSHDGASCEDDMVFLTFEGTNSPSGKCVADWNRSGGGDITYILCSGEECSLDASNFPDDRFWPPYFVGDTVTNLPANKTRISEACMDALRLSPQAPPPPGRSFEYRFRGVKTVIPDFGIETLCICPSDSIAVMDTLIIEVDTSVVYPVDTIPKDTISLDTEVVVVPEPVIFGKANPTEAASTNWFEVNQLFPNPTAGRLQVQLNVRELTSLQVRIHDSQYRKVYQAIEIVEAGEQYLDFDVQDLKGGFYILTLIDPEGQQVVMKFIRR